MSGIGNHAYAKRGEGAFGGPDSIAVCPYCGFDDCHADWVDVGVGMAQCGPFHCRECGASEMGALDPPRVGLTEKEVKTGWYRPGTPPSVLANTVDGKLVDHETALEAYRAGRLDVKGVQP